MAVQFINITRSKFLEEYKRLYRYTTVERLVQSLDSTAITFVNPALWSDPYETFYFNRSFVIDGASYMLPVHNRMYCMCMSGTYESEAFWKVYAPESDGVRITFSGRRLLENFLDTLTDADVFVGKVKYQATRDFFRLPLTNEDLIAEFESKYAGPEQLKLLLKKRSAFAYENELRIIIVPKQGQKNPQLLHVPGYAGDLINDVTLDPRMCTDHAFLLKELFLGEYGFRVAHSQLFSDLKRGPLVLR